MPKPSFARRLFWHCVGWAVASMIVVGIDFVAVCLWVVSERDGFAPGSYSPLWDVLHNGVHAFLGGMGRPLYWLPHNWQKDWVFLVLLFALFAFWGAVLYGGFLFLRFAISRIWRLRVGK